nr:ribonuclease H-like domain-containing protein [Tanacetum cinerariifolium]
MVKSSSSSENKACCSKSCKKNTKSLNKTLKKEKEGLESKLTGFKSASKYLENLLESQRPSPSVESNPDVFQNNSSSASEKGESSGSILFKPKIKFVRPADSPTVVKTDKKETVRKSIVKYAELYRKTLKRSNVKVVRSQFRGPRVSTVNRKFPTVNRKFPTGNSRFSTADVGNEGKAGNSQINIDNKGYWNSGCSRYMTGNISYLSDYEPYDEGYVSFGQGGCKITGKGTIETGKLEFKNVYFVKDLKYNPFSVSQICDNKNSVLFTDSECIMLGRDFKLIDDTNVLLRTPRQHNMYSIDLNNIVPHKDLTCLVSKASADECMLWHR